MRTLCWILVVPALAIHGEEKKGEADPFEGKWEVTSARFNGDDVAHLKGRVLRFADSKMIVDLKDNQSAVLSYVLDRKAKPMTIDLARASVDEKALGIVEFDKDEFRICYGEPGASRPKSFESKKGEKNFLIVLKRKKAD